MRWAGVHGPWTFEDDTVTFHGEPTPWKDDDGKQRIGYLPGLAMSSDAFTGGELSADVEFTKVSPLNTCNLVFFYDSSRDLDLSAGISGPPDMFAIRQREKNETKRHVSSGDRRNLQAGRSYHLQVYVRGSQVRLMVDGVDVVSTVLPFAIPPSQVGIHCFDDSETRISNFRVRSERGRVFVIMPLSSPFLEIYTQVIQRVCADDFHLEAINASEVYGPGIVMADVIRDIEQAEFIVAEITSANPNVFYELGYADAVRKPVIMLANRDELPRLPFDISASRVLFYEDSIVGRGHFEANLRQHISALLQKTTLPSMRGLTRR